MSNESDQRLAHRARSALDNQVDRLDATTLSRLTQARHRALAAAAEGADARMPRWWALGATGAAAGAALLLWQLAGQDPLPVDSVLAEFEVEELGEDLDLVEELEFYHWLEQQAGAPDKA